MRALVLVDIQPTFMPGGALPVPKGNEVVPVANEMIEEFQSTGDLVVATQDWHPEDHCSFAECYKGPEAPYAIFDKVVTEGIERTLWPKHGVQDTAEADFHPDLKFGAATMLIQKGMDPNVDSHSAFWGHARQTNTGLADKLRKAGVTKVYFMGLATDVCLILSALDAVEEGFETVVIIDGCRAITPEGHRKAVADMIDAGISVVYSTHLTSDDDSQDLIEIGKPEKQLITFTNRNGGSSYCKGCDTHGGQTGNGRWYSLSVRCDQEAGTRTYTCVTCGATRTEKLT